MRLGRQVDLGVVEHAAEEPADVATLRLKLAHRVAHAPDHVATGGGSEHVVGEQRIGRPWITGETNRRDHIGQRTLQLAMLRRRAVRIERGGFGHVAVVGGRLLGLLD